MAKTQREETAGGRSEGLLDQSNSNVHVAIDLETTGLSFEQDRIIEIGAVKFQRNKQLATFHTLVNPYRPLPTFIQRLTGITQADVDKAPPFAAVAGELEEFIGRYPIVGQNVTFDMGFLTSHSLQLSNVAYDTWDLASIVLPRAKRYSLSGLARELDVKYEQPHRALSDAEVTWKVFIVLLERLRGLDPGLLATLAVLSQRSHSALYHLMREALAASGMERGRVGPGGINGSELARRVQSWKGPPVPVSTAALSEEKVAALLSKGGVVSQCFPRFEHRPQQVEMAQAVARALSRDSHLVVEGGTGIGKSVAYMLPVLLFAMSTGKRVVVSTNTINLQEQLLGKDIPALAAALQYGGVIPQDELRTTTLKGRGNYLCLRRLQGALRADRFSDGDLRILGKALVWLQGTSTGDREEINLGGRDSALWGLVSAGDRAYCHGSRHKPCFLQAARERAEGAHVLVVNHALLLADVAMNGTLLPRYDHLIVDEAQHLEEVATMQLGFQAGQRLLAEEMQQMGRLIGPIHALLQMDVVERGLRDRGEAALSQIDGLLPRLREMWTVLWAAIYDFVARQRNEDGDRFQMRITQATRAQPDWPQVELAWENLDVVVTDLLNCMAQLLEVLVEVDSPDEDGEEIFVMELSSFVEEMSELKGQLRQLLVAPQPGHIYWVDQEEGGYLVLHAAPEKVGPILKSKLFDKKSSVVLASATLTVEGSFKHIRERIGFDEGDELVVGSPFDYKRAALVLVPTDMPDPDSLQYVSAVGKAIAKIAEAFDGHTLALFTSHSALRGVSKEVRGDLEAAGVRVLAQGIDGTARQLAEQFAMDPCAVILGTSSFWEGVDLAGGILRGLVLSRLPFNVPTDPVFAARCEQYESPFREYAVPQAVLRFRQGFGRLIRGEGDRGIVVILDKRVLTRNYGSLFLNSLPPCAIKRVSIGSLAEHAMEWLKE